MAVSDRQDPDGFHIDVNGDLNPYGNLRLDYVGVCEVEAFVPMDQVRIEVDGSSLTLSLPPIQLYAVVNYGMSFPWKETSRIPTSAVPNVMEAIRARAVDQAKERGVLDEAEASAEKWFRAFFEPLGYTVKVQFP